MGIAHMFVLRRKTDVGVAVMKGMKFIQMENTALVSSFFQFSFTDTKKFITQNEKDKG